MLLEMLKKISDGIFLKGCLFVCFECFRGGFKVVFDDYVYDDLSLSGISAL